MLPVSATNAAGPQGFAYDSSTGVLYVSDDANNTIFAIPDAATATSSLNPVVVTSGGAINAPEKIAFGPATVDLLVADAGDNTLVTLDPATGATVSSRGLDHGATGALFGIAVVPDTHGINGSTPYYDDGNTNNIYALPLPPAPPGPPAPPTSPAPTAPPRPRPR